MKRLGRMIVLAALGIAASVSTGTMAAGACTYGEALMALERNNTVRAMALMRMASADGDARATAFLARRDQVPTVLAQVRLSPQ
ncbi:MAG: hypothetical protein GXP17_09100 [Gammaproteobacteria bacterium]|nr:hypothetical protein [Gammaproteobacteria bacterium]